MKESEFYQRAATDAAFRKKQIEDLRYFENVGAGLMWFCAAVAIAFSLYGGFTGGKWDAGFSLFLIAIICATTRSTCSTRVAALRALDDKNA
jgi:hypothetical protein